VTNGSEGSVLHDPIIHLFLKIFTHFVTSVYAFNQTGISKSHIVHPRKWDCFIFFVDKMGAPHQAPHAAATPTAVSLQHLSTSINP
jgi:hypothetical protein